MQWKSGSRGAIQYQLIRQEGGGWDIKELTVRGQSALPPLKGEFETEDEAEKAAIEKAKLFAVAKGWLIDEPL
ncbi:hypothetical protein ACNFH5_09710 [Pseudomonas sp. NY15435]|uniref:hypothetical protein n=1 Tax=Pseudomonas sp. NY15435 TaxID=3400358 RepID=UPI003A8635F2